VGYEPSAVRTVLWHAGNFRYLVVPEKV